jgi:GTPase
MNRAVLVARPDKDVVEEAEALARAAGYEPVAVLTQRFLGRAKFGIGEGKAQELAGLVREKEADVVLFDAPLGATQAYGLAKLCKVEVRDREKVILEIFAKRASTAEAKLQVQLAEVEYELPKAKDRVRMARMGEQPGFFGLGKYEVDVYTRMMKSRIGVLRRKVTEVSKRREVFRRRREKCMLPTIALAGYTASGKTTLFNRLTGERKEADAGVFTTLSPTTRAIALKEGRALVTDTVGFISGLPAYLIEAFKSTLEEISYSSVVLLLLDASQSNAKFVRSYESSMAALEDLEVGPWNTVVVLNKCDLVPAEVVEEKRGLLGPADMVAVSAATGAGIDDLLEAIEVKLSERTEKVAARR